MESSMQQGHEAKAPGTPARADEADDANDKGETPPSEGKPRNNPWLPPTTGPRRAASIEDIFRKPAAGGASRFGGGGPLRFNLPPRADGKSWLPLIFAGIIGLWLLITSTHQLGNNEQGIVSTLGKYSRTIGPGVSFTLPWPIENVTVADVTTIRRESIPDSDAEKLMLTGDQNLVDLSYLVRWNIRDLKLYSYQLDDPQTALRDIAEAAMRASVGETSLNDVMGGSGRARIEQAVRDRMQAVLDAYRSGIIIQGVDIKKTDPPAQVNDAFQQVSAAEQEKNSDISRAQGFAQQVVAVAEGDAAAFDKVYAQYKLAPEVTRRRMYYETMERVLANNDKVIIEGNTTSYLPLPELRRTAPATAPNGAADANTASPGAGSGR